MEVVIISHEGIPQDSVISIRVGSMRRQCVFGQANKPFCFPIAPEAAGTIKVDVLSVAGCARALCSRDERDYDLSLKAGGVSIARSSGPASALSYTTPMSIRLKIRPASPDATPAESKEAVGSTGAVFDVHDKRKEDLDKYLADKGIMALMQKILQGIIQERPGDPYAFVANQFGIRPPEQAPKDDIVGTTAPYLAAEKASLRKAFTANAMSGDLSELIKTVAPRTPASGGTDALRGEVLQALVQGAANGNLLRYLSGPAMPPVEAQAGVGTDQMRDSARATLAESALNGELLRYLNAGAASQTQAASTAAADDSDRLRDMAREALLNGAMNGELLSCLGGGAPPAGGDAAANAPVSPELEEKRAIMKEVILAGAQNGSLLDALGGIGSSGGAAEARASP